MWTWFPNIFPMVERGNSRAATALFDNFAQHWQKYALNFYIVFSKIESLLTSDLFLTFLKLLKSGFI